MDEASQDRLLPTGERDTRQETLDKLEDIGRTTVKAAASAVLATTLVGALSEPPHTEMMSLPEPTPIVQMYQAADDVVPDEDDDTDDENKRWRRLLRALRYLLVVLALVGTVALGVLKGCAGIAGATLLPADDEREEQSATSQQTEDERGVAVGAGV